MRAEQDRPRAKHRLGRLLVRRDFLAAAATGRKSVAPGFVLQVRQRPGDPEAAPRYGLTASRKVGPAVQRNRARRRLRALAESVLPELARPGHDYVLIARRETPGLPYAAMRQDLERALRRLAGVAPEGKNDDNPTVRPKPRIPVRDRTPQPP